MLTYMLLAQVVETSRRVGETSKRLEKIDMIAGLLKQLHPDEIEGWRGVIEDGEVVKDHETAMREESGDGAESDDEQGDEDEDYAEDDEDGEGDQVHGYLYSSTGDPAPLAVLLSGSRVAK